MKKSVIPQAEYSTEKLPLQPQTVVFTKDKKKTLVQDPQDDMNPPMKKARGVY